MQPLARKRPRLRESKAATTSVGCNDAVAVGGASNARKATAGAPLTAADWMWHRKTIKVRQQLLALAQLHVSKLQEREALLDAIEEMVVLHEQELAAVASDDHSRERLHKEALTELHRRQDTCLTERRRALDEAAALQRRRAELERECEGLQEDIVMQSDALEQLQITLEAQREQTETAQRELEEVLARERLMESSFHGLSDEVREMAMEMEQIEQDKRAAERAARETEVLRRRYYSQYEELRGTIRVYCRVKGSATASANANNCRAGCEWEASGEAQSDGGDCPRAVSPGSLPLFPTGGEGTDASGATGRREPSVTTNGAQDGTVSQTGRFIFSHTESGVARTLCVSQPRKNASSTARFDTKEVFTFDRVFDANATQEDVYTEVKPLVNCAVDGYRVCIFAYGQTGSGKTYSMQGDVCDDQRCGITPRALHTIFERQEELAADGWKYRLSCFFVEIYNDVIRDLQQEPSLYEAGGAAASQPNYHAVKHNSETGSTTITGVSEKRIQSLEDFYRLYNVAMKHRSTGKTLLNDRSSRSHCVFVLRIEGEHAGLRQRSEGTLCMVDLAGSERVHESGVQGQQFKEAVNINRSLLDLGKCISAIGSAGSVAPWRNCKLTYLLQNFLGAKGGKMLMLVTVSEKEEHLAESLNSLRFASRVNSTVVGASARRLCNF
uniref:Kinesin-like protein n=1 Tax=Trypanosoma vivax (strain Y486) TaxID=1055687 RepID=G0UCC7_TRYVY|nr:putative C-terminal motor kinesin [Trypanosoma vivax Y486]